MRQEHRDTIVERLSGYFYGNDEEFVGKRARLANLPEVELRRISAEVQRVSEPEKKLTILELLYAFERATWMNEYIKNPLPEATVSLYGTARTST